MNKIPFYIVDVFATQKYQGNQLAVFLDLTNALSDQQMQAMAREINFAETTFIKEKKDAHRFVVRIFTPEHEIPFAGHPSLGSGYVIAKFLLSSAPDQLVLELLHGDIEISILEPDRLDESIFYMLQTQPQFGHTFTQADVAEGLGIPMADLDASLPIQEVSTGLPYILIPLKSLAAMEALSLDYASLTTFLINQKKHKSNSRNGRSTSLFFFTPETYESGNSYTTRMLLIENAKVTEDAATGSANGCFLAYLLKYERTKVQAVVEQGFQMNRKSYIYLDGALNGEQYRIKVGGCVKLVSEGTWYA